MKKWPLFLFLLVLSWQVSGQSSNPQAVKKDNGLKYGFGYVGHYKLNPRWAIHADVQIRFDSELKFTFQNVFRGGLVRYLKPHIPATAGYAFLTTHSEPFSDYFKEHRLWEQVIYLDKTSFGMMSYRFRAEHRFVEKLKFSPTGEVETEKFNYGNRLRFLNRTTYDLTKDPEAKDVLYVAIQDEIFLNVAAPELNRNLFDQNRFLVVIGVFKDKHTRLETGYSHIFLNPYKAENTTLHSLHFAVVQILDFGGTD